MNTKELGNLGERLACEYLVKKGFDILGKNYRISFGEIDIIARKKFKLFSRAQRPVHFVEVKTLRSETPQSVYPEDHVDFKKQRKLKNLAHIWLQKNKYKEGYPCQIDVIGIVVDENSRNAKLHYFPGAVGDV